MYQRRGSFPAAHVRPPSMGDDPAARHSGHVRIFEAMIPAKCGKVSNRSDWLPVGVDKSVMRLDELALANAILMSPPLVRLQFALALPQPVHAGKIQTVAAAKVVQIGDRQGVAIGVTETLPSQADPVSATCRMRINVETNAAVVTSRPLNPCWFRFQQLALFHVLQH